MNVTDKLIKTLEKAKLSTEDRVNLMSAVLQKLGAFPISNVIKVNSDSIVINDHKLDQEQAIVFLESVNALKNNYARKILTQQLKYRAIEMGVHKAQTIDELLFSKAVLWMINEENILIEKLSTE